MLMRATITYLQRCGTHAGLFEKLSTLTARIQLTNIAYRQKMAMKKSYTPPTKQKVSGSTYVAPQTTTISELWCTTTI